MHEGHKPSVSREVVGVAAAMSCCYVLFVYRKVPLACVCVLLRAMSLDGEIGLPSSLMTIECVSQDDSLLRAPEQLSGTAPH